MSDRLDLRTLNRTTLHRQHLLERVDWSASSMLDYLVGMQGQNPLDPYYGMWSRLVGFTPGELASMVDASEAVRGQLMRGTIHMLGSEDFRRLRPVFDPLCARILSSTQFGKDTKDLDLERLLQVGRALLEDAPRTRAELGPLLEEAFPGAPGASLAQAVTFLLPVVQPPPRGVWGRTGSAAWSILDPDPEDRADVESTKDRLILRYLAAFGPASVKDIRAWSGLTGIAAIVSRVRDRLRTYRDESGSEMMDLIDAVIIDPDALAPPRFLPEYDNVLLGHADRSRFFDGPTPPGWAGNLLVDGTYAGHWKISRNELAITLQRKVTSRQRRQVTDEAERLVALTGSPGEPDSLQVPLME
ncbi:MAG: winged helix DNA-binding domain-containing protein [Acidimicrobiia bacterium]